MDLVEINKLTRDKDVLKAKNNMYDNASLNKDDSTRLVLYACRKMYGLKNTVRIIHGLGVDHL